MSGVEVAGLTLTLFPIVVKGLGRMMEGIETIKHWKKYKRELDKYASRLGNAHICFSSTLTLLLDDIVPSDAELQVMIAEPLGPLWKKPMYEESLRSRLDQSYNLYLKTVKILAEDVENLRSKLGIDASGTVSSPCLAPVINTLLIRAQVQWFSYSVVEREMERIKITLRKKIYKELLDDIDRANKVLYEFTQQGISLEPIQRKRLSKRSVAELKLIRKHAASLYQVFMNDKAWRCSCKTHHVVSLCLEVRPQISNDVKTSTPQDYAFRVMITVSDPADPSGVTTRWEEIDVIPSVANQKLDVVLADGHHHPAARKGVRFASVTNESLAKVTLDMTTAQTDWTCIDDLCSALCTPKLHRRAIGILVDDAFDKQEHKLYRAKPVIKSQSLARSLEDLLESSRQPGDNSLSLKERLQIAVVLASSVLQLDGTSWLKTCWRSSDIYFHTDDSQPQGVARPSRFPCLSWQPCYYNTLPPAESFRFHNHMIRNDTLLALGLVLIELCFSRTLTEMRKPEDLDSKETLTELRTATRLYPRVYTEMGPLYGDVVRRCLFQTFDVRELSLDTEEVQQKVLEDVVAPLIIIILRLKNPAQPGRAITIRTGGTVFAYSLEGGGLDTLALETFGPLISNSDPERRINLGRLKSHYLHTEEGPTSPNLKEREGIQLLTISADGS
ncbi:MAG: hypothetical protein Q9205_006610, partial [Flavoplaca limonia]